MNAHATPTVDQAIDAVRGRTLPSGLRAAAFGGIAWGLGAFAYGLLAFDARWTWGAYLVAVLFFLAIAQGGVGFGVILQGTRSHWGRPLKRIAETFGYFLPYVWVALAIFLFAGGLKIYPWHPEYLGGTPTPIEPHMAGVPHAKALWLDKNTFGIRILAGAVILFGLSWKFMQNSMKGDLILAKARLGADAPAWWDRTIGGATDAVQAATDADNKNAVLVVFIGFAYALIMSMFAFDLVMSLDPWWVSNMFGGWMFMSSLLMSFAVLAIVANAGRDWLSLKGWVLPRTTHDLGRFMLAGTMFWAYTLFAQILPIYYTNVPEETSFLMVRMMLPQWSWLSQTVAVLCFIAPFTILLSRGIKKMRWPFVAVSVLMLVGYFLERSVLVLPSVYFGDTFPAAQFLIINVGVFAGFLGGFVLVVGNKLAQLPAVPVADPQLCDHPWDEHIHAWHPPGHGHGHGH